MSKSVQNTVKQNLVRTGILLVVIQEIELAVIAGTPVITLLS